VLFVGNALVCYSPEGFDPAQAGCLTVLSTGHVATTRKERRRQRANVDIQKIQPVFLGVQSSPLLSEAVRA
jgi:hypothetical protein